MSTTSKQYKYLKLLLKLNPKMSVSQAAKRVEILEGYLRTVNTIKYSFVL